MPGLAKSIITLLNKQPIVTIIFLMNISEFEYIYDFFYIVSSCCEAGQIYYNGK